MWARQRQKKKNRQGVGLGDPGHHCLQEEARQMWPTGIATCKSRGSKSDPEKATCPKASLLWLLDSEATALTPAPQSANGKLEASKPQDASTPPTPVVTALQVCTYHGSTCATWSQLSYPAKASSYLLAVPRSSFSLSLPQPSSEPAQFPSSTTREPGQNPQTPKHLSQGKCLYQGFIRSENLY